MQKKCGSMTGLPTKNQETIPLLLPERLAELSGVRFFFTTRRGGVSQGRYASLNLGGHVGDDPAAVACNRSRLESLWEGRELCYLNQVHGERCVELAGARPDSPPDADAWMTRQSGVVLAILTADCVPVLLADGTARVIGAAHAGWRGGALRHPGVLSGTHVPPRRATRTDPCRDRSLHPSAILRGEQRFLRRVRPSFR
ncbi:MAG: polyphenol oxidase family protein [Magnetococcus sp. YQC-3]